MPPATPKPVRVIGCGMLAREILAVRDQAGLSHIDLACLPAQFHHHPEKIAPAVNAAIEKARAEGFEHIFVAYADCGTGGDLDRVCNRHGVERVEGPHCFAFYQGLEEAEAKADEDVTSFFVTDFLARQYEAFLLKPLGMDRHPELIEMYFGNYERVVYLAQTDDPALAERARELADLLGLDFVQRSTGYGDLHTAMQKAAAF